MMHSHDNNQCRASIWAGYNTLELYYVMQKLRKPLAQLITIDVQTEYLVINDVNTASIAFFWLGKCKGFLRYNFHCRYVAICTLYNYIIYEILSFFNNFKESRLSFGTLVPNSRG